MRTDTSTEPWSRHVGASYLWNARAPAHLAFRAEFEECNIDEFASCVVAIYLAMCGLQSKSGNETRLDPPPVSLNLRSNERGRPGACTDVRRIRMPSERNTSSKVAENFASRSRMRKHLRLKSRLQSFTTLL